MRTVETVTKLREAVKAARENGKRIGFVPTMGNLHAGHMGLVDRAMRECEFVVASIFVNPLQFNDPIDLDHYPRTLAADQIHLEDHGCDLLFFPSVEEMYPNGQERQATVTVPEVSQGLCGGSRSGHFDGVATVVSKLFNMVQPDKAYFGQKDFQQLAVIRKLVNDMAIPVDIVAVETFREEDGLAMSSRNSHLSDDERIQATHLSKTLSNICKDLENGNRQFEQLCQQSKDDLLQNGIKPDYIAIYNSETLKPAQQEDKSLVVLGAAFVGQTRLIDNMMVELDSAALTESVNQELEPA